MGFLIAYPNNDEKKPLDELSFLSASDSRAMAFSSLLPMSTVSQNKRSGWWPPLVGIGFLR